MIDPLCGPCEDAGRMVKAHYMTNPPTCRECYQKRPSVQHGNTALSNLFAERLANKGKLRDQVGQENGQKLCEPCLEGGDRTKATHRLNDMDMCVTHANAARIDGAPPQALTPQDVEVKADKKPKAPIEGQAANFMASGLSAEETISALVNLGYGKREARAAVGEKREEKQMATRIDEATKADVIADFKAGMKINAIANKHSLSWLTAKTIVTESGVSQNGGGARKAVTKRAPKANGVGTNLQSALSVATGLLAKWNEEANAAFAVLPLEKKAALLASLEA